MKKILTKKNFSNVFDVFLVILGTFLMGFSFNVFLNSHRISPSGFSGICAIISNVLMEKYAINVPASIMYLGINAVMFIFAFKNMGLKFSINTAIGIAFYSLFIQVCKFNIGLADNDLILCAIYGGLLSGIGLGLVFKGHGSTGGSDMLANLLSKRYRFLTVGNIVLIVDALVVALSFVAYNNLNCALYSLIAIYIMTKMSDVIVSGMQSVRGYYIISKEHEKIAEAIINNMQRGVTGYRAVGMYTNNDEEVLMTLVTRSESVKLRQIVYEIDKKAFMFSCPISEAMGNGFMPLTKNKFAKSEDTETTDKARE